MTCSTSNCALDFLLKIDNAKKDQKATIADCEQFARRSTLLRRWFDVGLTKEHPRINLFYGAFKIRPGAVTRDEAQPTEIKQTGRNGLNDKYCEEEIWVAPDSLSKLMRKVAHKKGLPAREAAINFENVRDCVSFQESPRISNFLCSVQH